MLKHLVYCRALNVLRCVRQMTAMTGSQNTLPIMFQNKVFRTFSDSSCFWKPSTNSSDVKKKDKQQDSEKLLKYLTEHKHDTTEGNSTTPHEELSEEQKAKLKLEMENQKKRIERLTSFRVLNLLAVQALLFGIFACWYDPELRVRASNFSPRLGKFLDEIIEPVDKTIREKVGNMQSDNPVGAFLKKIVPLEPSSEGQMTSGPDNETKNSKTEK